MSQSPFFTVAFWLILLPALWTSGLLAGFRLRVRNPLFFGILTLGLGLGAFAYFLIFAGSFGFVESFVRHSHHFADFPIGTHRGGNSNTYGNVHFSLNLAAGSYTLCVVPKTGYKVTTPAGGKMAVKVAAGQVLAARMFRRGNFFGRG